ncbi:helix-turn-helix domain-containing protein [Georgenia thermotolerans]|uniref:Helix-turn-helix domain-containing protein n=1 Tax=Georgenia thermotolerans TaxID=527326 RepID=A0A7J5USK7_9MICO|nr:helix-turn-helix domain-containing protein [Georgenia thermotolerans]KAE8765386.1 helix-turn-helix domain-containing protein [Georgenia thermotolerans]
MSTLLDTRTVTPSDRPDYWSAGIAEHFFPASLQPPDDHPFAARLTGGDVGPIAVHSIRGVPHRITRTARMVAATDPDYLLLYLLRHGACRIEQDERSWVLGPGDIGFHDTSRPSAFEARDGLDVAVFSIPKWFLGAGADHIARATATPMPQRRRPMVRMAVPFLAAFAQAAEAGTLSEQEREGLSDMLGTMLRMLCGDDDAEELSQDRGARTEAFLTRMRRYALENLHDPGLGPEQIARAHFVSTRYVHKVFAEAGTGVSAWIREQRMERAAQELRESGESSIAHVASRWGYRDAASFSRAFRRAHGRSPRDVRAGA